MSTLNPPFLIIDILGISVLKDVIEALKQSHFPSNCWSPLGLQLGLLQPTLSHIRTKYRDDPETCLQECLIQWLSEADHVTESGGPTWDSLADALYKVGEDSAAEKVRAFNYGYVRTSHLLFPQSQLGKKLISAINVCKLPHAIDHLENVRVLFKFVLYFSEMFNNLFMLCQHRLCVYIISLLNWFTNIIYYSN